MTEPLAQIDEKYRAGLEAFSITEAGGMLESIRLAEHILSAEQPSSPRTLSRHYLATLEKLGEANKRELRQMDRNIRNIKSSAKIADELRAELMTCEREKAFQKPTGVAENSEYRKKTWQPALDEAVHLEESGGIVTFEQHDNSTTEAERHRLRHAALYSEKVIKVEPELLKRLLDDAETKAIVQERCWQLAEYLRDLGEEFEVRKPEEVVRCDIPRPPPLRPPERPVGTSER